MLLGLLRLSREKLSEANFWSFLPLFISSIGFALFYVLDEEKIENLDFKWRLKERQKVVENAKKSGKTGIQNLNYTLPLADKNRVYIQKCLHDDTKFQVKFYIIKGYLEQDGAWLYAECYDENDPKFSRAKIKRIAPNWYKIID
ncbi:MAG: hypothetical protein HC817_15250 [Saprospiraceae bacterium]|nr:hypothetical protein [Saprospiraceae bacterium]